MNFMKKSLSNQIRCSISVCCAAVMLLFTSSCFAESESKSINQYVKNFESIFRFVQQNYVDEIDPKILYEGALKGMMDSIGDPYTVYLDSDAMRDLTDTTAGSFGGVGLSISKPVESTPEKPAYVEVSSPIEDSPGAKAGIQAGDLIVEIEGESTADITMNQVLDRLRGEVGTPVTITILRGKNMRFNVTLVRALIEVPTVKYAMIENTKIGYMRLIQFTPETPNRVQDALNSFEANGYKSLIIDLRDNPGGLISSVVEIADKFIDNGPIVTTKSRLSFENSQYSAKEKRTTVKKDIPIVVLINRGSASASEILSGCLKDYHRAYLIGQRTYGKGSVQQVIPLSNIDGIKLTMARYYTPSDVNIDKIGIPPDLEILNMETMSETEEATYVKLINDGAVAKIVAEYTDMTEADIADAAVKLHGEYELDNRILRRLIRNESQRSKVSPIYDLDYDLQLNAAIQYSQLPGFFELVKSTKTLKQLQDEVDLSESNTTKEK